MAPRHVPRRSRPNSKDVRPRSRHQRFTDVEESAEYFEVPFYAAFRTPKTVKDAMRLKMILRSGSTCYGVPVGMTANIVYPLSEEESSLLNSMVPKEENAIPVVAEPYDPIMGDWMTAFLLQ